MAAKTFALSGIGNVTVSKRRNSRRINLSISPSGKVRVSIPYWMPYKTGIDFAKNQQNWILKKLPKQKLFLPNQNINKTHKLLFIPDEAVIKPNAKIVGSNILINHPPFLDVSDPMIQKSAQSGIIKVLSKQAGMSLPNRIEYLSSYFNLPYSNLKIKKLSRRWGSCDINKSITLNLFLVQLPDELIDYVICHELTHTKVLNHSPQFWQSLETILPNYKQLKNKMKSYTPDIIISL